MRYDAKGNYTMLDKANFPPYCFVYPQVDFVV